MSILRITEGTHTTEIEGSWTVFTDKFNAHAGQISHFTSDVATNFGFPDAAPKVSDDAFIPIITPMNDENTLFKSYEIVINEKEKWDFSDLIDENFRSQKSHEIKFTSESQIARIKFKAEKGSSNANDGDGGNLKIWYFSDEGNGSSFEYKIIENIKYGDTFFIDWDKRKNIFQLQFYADDNDWYFDGDVKNVYCGAVKLKGSKVGRRLTKNIEKLGKIPIGYISPPLFENPQLSFNVANKYQNCLGMCFAVSMKRVEKAYLDQWNISDAITVSTEDEDYRISGTITSSIDDRYFGYGVGGTLAKNGYADLVSNEDIWNGKLEEGAHLQYWANKNHQDWNELKKAIKDNLNGIKNNDFSYGHSVIFKSYIYGREGEIIGMNYYDYHGIENEPFLKSDEYTLPNVPKIFMGANLKDIK